MSTNDTTTDNQDPRHARPPLPWRSALRDTVAGTIAFLPVLVIIVDHLKLSQIPLIAAVAGIAAGLSSALSHPTSVAWLNRYVYGYGAEDGKHRADENVSRETPQKEPGL